MLKGWINSFKEISRIGSETIMYIRPLTFPIWGVYASNGENTAEVVFQGTCRECLEYVRTHSQTMYIPLEQRILEKTKGVCAFNNVKPCKGLCNNCGLNRCETTTNTAIVKSKSNYRLYDVGDVTILEDRCLDMPDWD